MKNLSGEECSETDVPYAVFDRTVRERDEAKALLRGAQVEREVVAEQHETELHRLRQRLAALRAVAEERCPELTYLSDWTDITRDL